MTQFIFNNTIITTNISQIDRGTIYEIVVNLNALQNLLPEYFDTNQESNIQNINSKKPRTS